LDSRPLSPAFQFERDEYVGELEEGDDQPSPLPSADSLAALSITSPSVASIPPTSESGPHVLVSFHHNFDENNYTTSSQEARSDKELVDSLMRKLRRAFQGGIEDRIVPSNHGSIEISDRTIQLADLQTRSHAAFAAPLPLTGTSTSNSSTF